MTVKPKILVIGIDSTPASLLFTDLLNSLPTIKKMIENGISATLESCHPPITVPAWNVMMTSRSPGKLGIYGFRHRNGFSYNKGLLVNSETVKEPRVWDLLMQSGKKVCLVGVPPAYPPFKVNGNMISCFLTPKNNNNFTFPPEFADEIKNVIDGNYLFDVPFRIEDREEVLKKIYEMTEKRFSVIKYMLLKKEWDFFMFVEIGVDRLHHMFWKYYDKSHPKYLPGNKYEHVIPQYYQYLDTKIGELLSIIPEDTFVFIVSDHGTASMKGAFCINEWLIKEGYLSLRKYPDSVLHIDECDIDWKNTTAWGWGGYYARMFLNVKGREENGKIPFNEFKKVRDELKSKLSTIAGPRGEKFDNVIFYPEDIYDECNGSKPDLMVYFDNLFWRSAGTVGHNALYLDENDTGPDDSVHWMDGIFLLYNKRRSFNQAIKLNKISIYDIAPTILDLMDMTVPDHMQGKVIREVQKQFHNK
jgi:predicted AlkP superfamily phosphohydrolase/phosphomutase